MTKAKVNAKEMLKKKGTLGIWATLGASCIAEIISSVGFDWILFDCEHGANRSNNLADQLNAVRSFDQNIACIVRAGSNDIVEIKRILDVGVDGIMIPMICSRAEAELVIKYCNYPKVGMRGVSGICRASGYGLRKDYLERASNELCILIQVENTEGINNLDDILSVDGIDGVFIGPSDLAASMGKLGKPSDEKVEKEILRALNRILKKGIPAGTIALSTDGIINRFRQRFTFVATVHDAHFFTQQLNAFKNSLSIELKKSIK